MDIVLLGNIDTVGTNQTLNGSKWNLLGKYSLLAGANTCVTIRNDGTSDYVEADAVRFLKKTSGSATHY